MGNTTKILIAIILSLIVAAGIIGYVIIGGDQIRPNISIEGIDVSGLTLGEAEQKLKTHADSILENLSLTFVFTDRKWSLNYKEIGYTYDLHKALSKAYSIGRSGGYFKRVFDVINSSFNTHEFMIEYSYNDDSIVRFIENLGYEIDQEMVDATITFKKPNFTLTDDVEGRKLDKAKTYEIVIEEIKHKSSSIIELPVDIVEPIVKKSDLMNIRDVIGEFATKFNAADTDRTHNIMIATNSASNILLHPGEMYSINQVIGPRLEKFGFKEAKVIINNELVPGIGGGVCQVSSTLYNAALLSNLKIVERRNHSLPLSYVSLGRDATISGDYIDFKFMNSTEYPVYIYGEVVGSWVKFYIYGRNDYPDRKISIQTETVKVIEPTVEIIPDPTLPEGTEIEEKKAHIGYIVKSYRLIHEDGKLLLKEPLFTDTYKVVNGVKRVGTGEAVYPGDGLNSEQGPIDGVNGNTTQIVQ